MNSPSPAVWIVHCVFVPSSAVLVNLVCIVVWDLTLVIETVVIDLIQLATLNALAGDNWVVDALAWAVGHLILIDHLWVIEAGTGFLIELVKSLADE